MAGGNPLDDLLTRQDGLDPNAYTNLRPRRSGFRAAMERRKKRRAMRSQAAIGQAAIAEIDPASLGTPAPRPGVGMGDVRKAESEMAAEEALQEEIAADPQGWVAKQREMLEENKRLVDAYIAETLALDPTRDAQTINQRTKQIVGEKGTGGLRGELARQEKALGEFEAQLSAQDAVADPAFFQKALGGLADVTNWSPVKSAIEFLSGPQEIVTGVASLAAEGLGSLVGTPTQYTPTSLGTIAEEGFGIGALFNPDASLRVRGRQFTDEVGTYMDWFEREQDPAGLRMKLMLSAPRALGLDMPEDDARHLVNTMSYQLVTDPTALIDAGVPVMKVLGKAGHAVEAGAMKIKPVSDFLTKHPSFINKPKAFWLRLAGEHKKADTLGNPLLDEIRLHEEAFNADAGVESLRYQSDLKRQTRDIMNDLTAAQRAEVLEKVPTLVENPTYKAFAKSGLVDELSPDAKVRDALYAYADVLSDANDDILKMEQRWGLKTAQLAEDFEYFGRQYSDEVIDYLARRPDARKVWLGTKAKMSRDALRSALEAPEHTRTLRGMGFEESEAAMRKTLGLPDDMPVWGREATDALVSRAERSLEAAKIRNLTRVASDVYGFTPDGADTLARQMVRAISDTNPDVAKLAPADKAKLIEGELLKAGLAPQQGQMTALQLLTSANVKLPDNLEDLAALGVKYLDQADGEEFMKYAKNHYWQHFDKPNKFWKAWDTLKGIYQRSTLARVASLTKDLLGTTTQSFMANNLEEVPGALKALGGLGDWKAGITSAEDVMYLRARGVLRTTKGDALKRGNLPGKLGNIEQSGMIGGTLRSLGAEKAGKAVGETIGTLNEARVYWEEAQRVATYRKAIKQGMTPDQAVNEVYKYWGKFDELSKLERTVLNRIMFFWSWMARSVPVALRTTLEHPVRARLLLTLMAGDVTDNDNMPEWMRRMGGYVLGQNDDGTFDVINTGGSTYFSPTMSALQSDFMRQATNGRFDLAAKEIGREVMRSAPPFATGAYEALTETETFSGKNWYKDPGRRVGTQIQAPAGYYWLDGTALGDWLGVEVETDPDTKNVTRVLMDPAKANIMGMIPGLEPALTDASSFVDPRASDAGPLSLRKGVARTLGVPMYKVVGENDAQVQAAKFKTALYQSVDAMPGNALAMVGGRVRPNSVSERGREIQAAMERLEERAKANNLGSYAADAYVFDNLRAMYPQETEFLELDARLRLFEQVADAQREAGIRIKGQPLPSLKSKVEKQDKRELARRYR